MIIIDCHEPPSIIEQIKTQVPVAVLKLKFGDYSFSDTIVERKTLSDFFASLKDKRLRIQFDGMSRYYRESYLLIEGFFDFTYVTNIDYLYSQLFDLTLRFDAKIIFSKDSNSTASTIKKLFLKKNRGYAFADV